MYFVTLITVTYYLLLLILVFTSIE